MSNNHPTEPADHLDDRLQRFMTPKKVQALGFRELLNIPSTVPALDETVHRVLRPAAAMG